MAQVNAAKHKFQKLLKDHQKTVPILPFFPVMGGLPNSQKKAFLDFFAKQAKKDIPNDAKKYIDDEGLLDGIADFRYGQFIAYGPEFDTSTLSTARVLTEKACHYALLAGLHKNDENFDVNALTLDEKIDDNSFFNQYFKSFVEFAQQCESDASFPKDDMKDGISFINIWDVSDNKALASFLKCYNGCFTNGCMCLFLDLKEDVPNLHKPLDLDDSEDLEMMWRSRLHYLLHSCKILSQDKNDDRSNFCSIIANYSAQSAKLQNNLIDECQHAAPQIGVDHCLDYNPIFFNSEAHDSQENVFTHFNKLMLKRKPKKVPLSWIFLRGVLDGMGNNGSVIIDDKTFREHACSQMLGFEKHDQFCKFFASFGSIFYIKKTEHSSLPLIVIKPIEFIRRLHKLFRLPASCESDNGVIKYGIVTEEVADDCFGSKQSALFLTVLQSVNFAVKLKTSQVLATRGVDTFANNCYYIPSVRSGEPVMCLSYHAVHLCIDIMSPIVNIEVAIVAKLFNNGLNPCLELTEEINVTHIRMKTSEALLSISCQGDVIEFKITDTENEDVIEEMCSHIISACKAVVKELSVDKKHKIKYNFQVLCKNDVYAKVPYNIYHLRHTLPADYLCHDCFEAGILNHQVRAWNKALTKNPIDPDYLLTKDISEDPDIITLSKEIANYPLIALDAFAYELRVQFDQHDHFNNLSDDEKSIVVREMICRWLKQEHQQTSTSLKTELAKKLMKLHNAFEKQPLELKKNPQIEFNVLARRLDIQVCSNKQLSDLIETSSSNYSASTTEIPKSNISSYLSKLAVILQPVQEDWEQLGLQLNIDQSVLTDIRNKRDSTEQMKYLLEEWALKGGTLILTQLEDALLHLGKKELIPDLCALQEKESIVINTSEQISTKSNDKSNYTSVDSEQNSSTDTLSGTCTSATDKILVEKQEKIEKLTKEKEATDKVLVEKQEIEMLTKEKEATDKILVEKQEEIEKLTKEKEATDKVLVEKQEEIERLTREKKATDKVLVEKQEEIEKLTREKALGEELDTLKRKILTDTESKDDLKSVIPAGETVFVLRGRNQSQHFNWEKYGISFSAPEGILPLTETCEVAITALAGGEFKFPEDIELVSAVYAISIAKPLLKPLTVNIQHCVLLETPKQCNSLQFMRAPIDYMTLPYQFEPLPGGHFTPGNQYGSISCSQFCLIAVGNSMEEVNTSDKEDGSSQKSEDPHISEDGETNDSIDPKTTENGLQVSNYKESGKGATDETNDDDKNESETQSDKVRHKPLPKTDSASQNAAVKLVKKADISFFCKVYYEEKDMLEWQVMFTVVKNLDALQQYIKKCHPRAEENQSIDLTLKSQTDVEFDIQKYHDKTPNGWEIRPRRLPLTLKYTSIKKFGSDKCLEPPSCIIDVYADEENDTAKRLHYKVPVLGMEQCTEIFINLSLRRRYDTIESAASCRHPVLSDDKVTEVKKIIQDVLTKQYSELDTLLKASMKSFATDMYSHGLISETTKDAANFTDTMREFKSGMSFTRDGRNLMKCCQLFLQSLAKQGGPNKRAASSIAEEWTANIKEKLNINIEFDIE